MSIDGMQASYDASHRMARAHDDIAEDIEALAATLATGLDGGEGTEFILNGLASLGTAAGQASQVSASAADRLREMVDLVKGVDAEADADFRTLGKQLR